MSETGTEKKAERAEPAQGMSVGNTKNLGLGDQTLAACDEKAGDGSTKLMEEVLRPKNLNGD